MPGRCWPRRSVPIGADDTTTIVESMLAIRGAELLVKTLDAIEAGTARETPQDESLVTYAPKLAKTEGLVDWSIAGAAAIHNLIRGLWPWPHAFTLSRATRATSFIARACRASGRPSAAPGTIVARLGDRRPACRLRRRHGARAARLQLEGKRVMSARDAMAAKALSPARSSPRHDRAGPARRRRRARRRSTPAISTWASAIARVRADAARRARPRAAARARHRHAADAGGPRLPAGRCA